MGKYLSLQVVRALAAISVILFHIETAFDAHIQYTFIRRIFEGGHRGVDLFFVLSGFIILFAHAKDLSRPEAWWSYLYKRIIRIYPSVWILSFLAVCLYAAGFGAAEKVDKLEVRRLIASFLLLPQTDVPLVNVTWTLTYEIFFYAIFSCAIIHRRLGFVVLAFWQVASACVAISGANSSLYLYYLKPIVLDFGVGLCSAAFILRTKNSYVPLLVLRLLLLSGVLLFVSGMYLNRTSEAGIFCALGAGFIIISLVRLEDARKTYSPKVLVMLGESSYSIYLVHFSVISISSAVVRKIGFLNADLLVILYLGLGLIFGILFDRLIDKPVHSFLRRRSILKTSIIERQG